MQAPLGTPRETLDLALVLEALSLVRGGRFRHGCDVLDLQDNPTGETLNFTDGSVTWASRALGLLSGQTLDSAAVQRTAVLNIVGDVALNLQARRIRIWTEQQMLDGTWARYYLGVFVCPKPALTDDGILITQTLALVDKSQLWLATTVAEPFYLEPTVVVTDWVLDDLLTRFGETRFAILGSPATLGGPGKTVEADTPWLQVYTDMLRAVGYDQLSADESGRPLSVPLADITGRAPEILYGAGAGKIVEAGSVEPLQPDLPNVVRFVARQGPGTGSSIGNGLAERENQSTGPGSLDARSGQRVEVRVEVDAADQAALEEIADVESQRLFAGGGMTWSGAVGLNPRHSSRDVIALDLPRLGLDPSWAWQVSSWTYPLAPLTDESGALMQVVADRRVG